MLRRAEKRKAGVPIDQAVTTILEGEGFVRLHGQFIEVVHPGDRTSAWSLQTVGFHAHASDIKIALERIHLPDHVILLCAAFFIKHAFPSIKTLTSFPLLTDTLANRMAL
jgi:hypothetical protein